MGERPPSGNVGSVEYISLGEKNISYEHIKLPKGKSWPELFEGARAGMHARSLTKLAREKLPKCQNPKKFIPREYLVLI